MPPPAVSEQETSPANQDRVLSMKNQPIQVIIPSLPAPEAQVNKKRMSGTIPLPLMSNPVSQKQKEFKNISGPSVPMPSTQPLFQKPQRKSKSRSPIPHPTPSLQVPKEEGAHEKPSSERRGSNTDGSVKSVVTTSTAISPRSPSAMQKLFHTAENTDTEKTTEESGRKTADTDEKGSQATVQNPSDTSPIEGGSGPAEPLDKPFPTAKFAEKEAMRRYTVGAQAAAPSPATEASLQRRISASINQSSQTSIPSPDRDGRWRSSANGPIDNTKLPGPTTVVLKPAVDNTCLVRPQIVCAKSFGNEEGSSSNEEEEEEERAGEIEEKKRSERTLKPTKSQEAMASVSVDVSSQKRTPTETAKKVRT